MTTTPLSPTADAAEELPLPPASVEELCKLLVKAVRARQLYLPNNPTYLQALERVQASFRPLLEQANELVLVVTETEFRYGSHVVLLEEGRSSDSLPWILFKDGIRELRFLRGFEDEELVRMIDLLLRARKASPDEDDLLTLLWEGEFLSLRYRFVDLALEGTPPLELSPGQFEGPAGGDAAPGTGRPSAPAEDTPAPGFVSLADFDSSLYFLDERELEYLRQGVREEYDRDQRLNILSILLDVFELQTSGPVREEIVSILDALTLHLLSAGQFRAVAFLLREAAASAQRAREIGPEQRDRLLSLSARLSQPETLAQLLQGLDDGMELPPQADLEELFGELRPSALHTVFQWLGRLQVAELRTVLEHAAARLASQHTGELVRLVSVPDATVAIEAIRRSGGLRTQAAVPALARVVEGGALELRQAAAAALAEIGSPGALQALEKSLADADRQIRLIAARALAARAYRQSLPHFEAMIRSRSVKDRDPTEKMAMFEAYGVLGGDASIALLDEILNAKSFLGRREDPELRACAAIALGRVGSPKALDALRKSADDKDVVVRNAVGKAIRRPTTSG